MTYTCPICGKNYLSPVDMAKCATKCANGIENSRAVKEAEMEVKDAYTKLLYAITNYEKVGGKNKYEASLKIGSSASCRIYGDTFTKDVNLDNAKVTFADVAPKNKTKSKSDLEDFCKSNCNIDEPKHSSKPKLEEQEEQAIDMCELLGSAIKLAVLAEQADNGDEAAEKEFNKIYDALDKKYHFEDDYSDFLF